MRHLMMCVVGDVRRLRMTGVSQVSEEPVWGERLVSAIKGLHVTKWLPPLR